MNLPSSYHNFYLKNTSTAKVLHFKTLSRTKVHAEPIAYYVHLLHRWNQNTIDAYANHELTRVVVLCSDLISLNRSAWGPKIHSHHAGQSLNIKSSKSEHKSAKSEHKSAKSAKSFGPHGLKPDFFSPHVLKSDSFGPHGLNPDFLGPHSLKADSLSPHGLNIVFSGPDGLKIPYSGLNGLNMLSSGTHGLGIKPRPRPGKQPIFDFCCQQHLLI